MSKKKVLITGASRGIGRAIALKLVSAGFYVTPCASKQTDEFDELVSQIKKTGHLADALTFDVSDTEESKSKILTSIEKVGPYWGVISNAGIARDKAFPSLSEEDWKSVINVDLNGFFNVVQPCIMPMISLKDGGRIIAMSSVSGICGNRGQANYSAAKAGLIGAVKTLAIELAKRKITANCIAPGLIETEMVQINELAMKMAMEAIPLRRMGKPEEVAALASFLMSPEASYITRQVISINGGML